MEFELWLLFENSLLVTGVYMFTKMFDKKVDSKMYTLFLENFLKFIK